MIVVPENIKLLCSCASVLCWPSMFHAASTSAQYSIQVCLICLNDPISLFFIFFFGAKSPVSLASVFFNNNLWCSKTWRILSVVFRLLPLFPVLVAFWKLCLEFPLLFFLQAFRIRDGKRKKSKSRERKMKVSQLHAT